VNALSAVVDAKNDIISTCGTIHDLNGRASSLLASAVALFGIGGSIIGGLVATFGVAGAVAIIVGSAIATQGWLLFLIGAFAAILVAIALTLLLAYAALMIAAAVVQGTLGGKRDAWNKAFADVKANCPTTCWGDTSLPSC
jgi:hypothetical protein